MPHDFFALGYRIGHRIRFFGAFNLCTRNFGVRSLNSFCYGFCRTKDAFHRCPNRAFGRRSAFPSTALRHRCNDVIACLDEHRRHLVGLRIGVRIEDTRQTRRCMARRNRNAQIAHYRQSFVFGLLRNHFEIARNFCHLRHQVFARHLRRHAKSSNAYGFDQIERKHAIIHARTRFFLKRPATCTKSATRSIFGPIRPIRSIRIIHIRRHCLDKYRQRNQTTRYANPRQTM